MAKTKTREISIKESRGRFALFKAKDFSKKDYDFDGLLALRQLLNNEKARILHVLKNDAPNSIYDLAKKLNRGFKAVNDDLKLLERFGFIEFEEEKVKNRVRHKPVLVIDSLTVKFRV